MTLLALLVAGLRLASLPKASGLTTQNPTSSAFLERHQSAGGEAQLAWVPYDRISVHLKKSVVVAEDINFFHHQGFEFSELRKAVQETLSDGKKLRGASTLTQQLAKNLWLTPTRNPVRKLDEAVLTRRLERHLSKRRILEIYLNIVEFGPGVFGAEKAARHYFGKAASQLTPEESALLAASLPHSRWSPQSKSDSYAQHVSRIRARVSQAAWLNPSL